ncbi:MAG: LysM peptidoglycan-binding domain-containing protein [Pseudomonadota bacterium]
MVIGAVVVIGGVGAVAWFSTQDDTADAEPPVIEAVAEAAPEPVTAALPESPAAEPQPSAPEQSEALVEAEPETAAVDAAQEQPAPPPPPAPTPPSFDVVRIEADGTTLVAGTADPELQVEVLLDDVAVADAFSDAAGNFAALFFIDPSDEMREMALRALAPGGAVLSAETVIVSPFGPPPAAEEDTIALAEVPEAAPEAPAEELALAAPEAPEPDPPSLERKEIASAREEEAPEPASELADADVAGEDAAPVTEEARDEPAQLAAAPEDEAPDPEPDTQIAALDEEAMPEADDGEADKGTDAAPARDAEQPAQEVAEALSEAAKIATDTAAEALESVREDVADALETASSSQDTAPVEPVDAAPEPLEETTEVASAPAPVEPKAEDAPAAEEAPAEDDAPAVEEAPAEEDAPALAEEAPRDAPEPSEENTELASAPAAADEAKEPEAPAEPEAEEVAQVSPRPEAPQVFITDETGVRLLEGPQVMDDVALDTITYDETGSVSLAGRGVGAGFVRIYVNDRPVTTTQIAVDGTWRTDLPNVDSGVYTLRVDELAADGAVISRVETPFLREEPAFVASIITSDSDTSEILNASQLTVQPGATLWGISRAKYGLGRLYVKIFDANQDRIRDPDLIYPGQIFDLPD